MNQRWKLDFYLISKLLTNLNYFISTGYKAHIPGIGSANIFGQSYAKSTAVAVKGEYSNKVDLPSDERYLTISKQYFTKPKVRSEEEGKN